MDVGTGLLWVGLILAVGSSIPLAAHLASGSERYRKLARILLVLDFGVVTAAFLLVVYYFLALDLSIAYVHSHTRVGYPWYYRLSGAWSGDVGSILLWAWFQSLVVLLFSLGGKKDTPSRARVRTVSVLVLTAILAAFLYALIAADPFKPTSPIYLISEGTNNGLGMSPLLLTPLVIIHPPLEFIAYALISVPFAASLSYLLAGRGDWTSMAMQWTRAAWLLLTLAVLIGALWAYTTLGWGGYWSWDPVETANLVVWLPLTGLVHAQLWSRRKRQFPYLSILLACLSFALMMFATFETRTGIIVSVHSFTPAGGTGASPDLGTRLVSVLGSGGAVPYFHVMMVVALLVTGAAFLAFFTRLRLREGATSRGMLLVPAAFVAIYLLVALWAILDVQGATKATLDAMRTVGLGRSVVGFLVLSVLFVGIPLLWILLTSPKRGEDAGRDEGWVSDDGTMLLAVALFLLWGLVTLGLMVLGANSLNPAEFEARLPFLLIPVCAVLFAALSWRLLGRSRLPYVLLILGFVILVSYVLFSSNLGALYFPLAFALMVICLHRIGKSWAPALLAKGLRLSAMLSLLSLILAFVMWSSGANEVRLMLFRFESSLVLNLLGSTASLAGIILLALGISRRDWRLWMAATGMGIALIGFLIGSVLAVLSLVFLIRSSGWFEPGVKRRAMALTSILRGSSPPLIHLGVALVVLGYAASAYFATEAQVTATADVATESFSGYQYRLVGSRGEDEDADGLYEAITAEIFVARGGVPQFTVDLRLSWRVEGVSAAHYLPDAFVHSHTTGDFAFTFLGFSDGIRAYSVNDQPAIKASSDSLTSVIFQVKESPLMVSLWGGGWLMAVGMGARMWSERGLFVYEPPEQPPAMRAHARPPEPRPRDEDYYRRQLEREIGGGEG
ncbi:MAG: cytochrome c biogenesis protein CcsA [Candidatus Thermoplasmatota archaeon]